MYRDKNFTHPDGDYRVGEKIVPPYFSEKNFTKK